MKKITVKKMTAKRKPAKRTPRECLAWGREDRGGIGEIRVYHTKADAQTWATFYDSGPVFRVRVTEIVK